MTTVGNLLPSSNSPLGQVEIVEVFTYYDGPLIFSARNEQNQWFLVIAADQDDTALTYLYAPLTEIHLRRVTSGRLPLRSAFLAPLRGTVFSVTVPTTTADAELVVRELTVPEIPAEWLPSVGVRIVEPPDESLEPEPFSEDPESAHVRQEHRTTPGTRRRHRSVIARTSNGQACR